MSGFTHMWYWLDWMRNEKKMHHHHYSRSFIGDQEKGNRKRLEWERWVWRCTLLLLMKMKEKDREEKWLEQKGNSGLSAWICIHICVKMKRPIEERRQRVTVSGLTWCWSRMIRPGMKGMSTRSNRQISRHQPRRRFHSKMDEIVEVVPSVEEDIWCRSPRIMFGCIQSSLSLHRRLPSQHGWTKMMRRMTCLITSGWNDCYWTLLRNFQQESRQMTRPKMFQIQWGLRLTSMMKLDEVRTEKSWWHLIWSHDWHHRCGCLGWPD